MYITTKNYQDFCLVDGGGAPLQTFQGAVKAQHSLPGDQVLWTNEQCQIVQRASYGWIVGTVELASKYLYGHTSRGAPIYLFHPMNPAFPVFRVGCSLKDTSRNQLALVEFADWPASEKLPRANLLRLLGPVGEATVEREALRWLYGFPRLTGKGFQFSGPLEDPGLRPLVEGQTINIDPPGCQDIDDVVSLRQTSADTWELVITIADVAAWIPEEGETDAQALQKTQTLYENGRAVVPMVPAILSEDKASLVPGQERLGISLFAEWNEQDKRLALHGFKETRIRNQTSYTYETIYDAEKSGAFPVAILRAATSHLANRDLTDSHEWVEQLMILYNKEVAKILLQADAGLVRTHTAPERERVLAYEAIHPDLTYLAYSSAQYAAAAPGRTHAALGDSAYAHASSPLRRYADLLNQRVLKAWLKGQHRPAVVPSLAQRLNDGDKRHRKHDRDLFFLEQVLERPAGRQSGVVVETNEKRTKVYVPAWRRLVSVKHKRDDEVKTVWSPKDAVEIDYYVNLYKPNWKERFVMRISGSGV